MGFSIIVATDQKRGIGKNQDLPWHLSKEMAYFAKITTETDGPDQRNAVIMGRTTFFSIPEKFRPLKNRLNIVITSYPELIPSHELVLTATSLDSALELAKTAASNQVFVIGGATLYRSAVSHPDCDTLLITEIEADFGCDAFFPAIPNSYMVRDQSSLQVEGEIPYRFTTYARASQS